MYRLRFNGNSSWGTITASQPFLEQKTTGFGDRSSQPVPSPYVILFFRAPEPELYVDDVLEAFFYLRLL
jgi:hypothetical protein